MKTNLFKKNEVLHMAFLSLFRLLCPSFSSHTHVTYSAHHPLFSHAYIHYATHTHSATPYI